MKKLIMAAAMLAGGHLFAQNTTWYFGTQGTMKMTGGNPGPPPAGGNVISTNEGCANIVDAVNNVVMYTDGTTLWNGAGAVQAGTNNIGQRLMGSSSSTQSALIIPIPGGDCKSFFVFTTAAAETDYGQSNGTAGFRVSKVTVSGNFPYTAAIAVGDRNVNVLANTAFAGELLAEKLCATPDGQGGYWVLAHGVGVYGDDGFNTAMPGANNNGQGRFYAVNVNANTTTIGALALTLVTSNFPGIPHRSACHPYASPARFNGQGQMKFNPQGTQIALVQTYLRQAEVYNFNLSTGLVTGGTILNSATGAFGPGVGPNSTECTTYGVEFSPGIINAGQNPQNNPAGRFLYVSTTYRDANPLNVSRVYQFDLSSGNANAISASRTTLASGNTDYHYGALQVGPNGDIYVARNNGTALDAIVFPDVQGIFCGYMANNAAIGGTCRLGLPTVLVYNPCEGNTSPWVGDCPDCIGAVGIGTYVYDIAGNGSLNLPLTSGVPIKKLKVYIANYTLLTQANCQSCVSSNTPTYGTFYFAQTIQGTPAVLTPHTQNVTATYSREATWSFPAPVTLNNTSVNFLFTFPPALTTTGCYNRIGANIKIEYTDVNCVVCEKELYVIFQSPTQGGGGGDDGRMENPDGLQAIDKAMRVYPNPATDNITVQLINLKAGGTLEILNAQGEVVQQEQTPGDQVTLDTSNLANGVYLVRFVSEGVEYLEKLVIQH